MDKRQKSILASILILMLIVVVLIGFTFAKYYSTYNGISESQIAKWKFKVNGWSTSKTAKISLINTADDVTLEDGKIAPGASGKFDLELDATDSEVDVKYYIEVKEEGNKPSNLLFSVEKDGVSSGEKYSSLSDLAKTELSGVIAKSDENKVVDLQIVWEWPYETGDEEDEILSEDLEDTAYGSGTVEGKENVFDYTFSLKVVGTQAKK